MSSRSLQFLRRQPPWFIIASALGLLFLLSFIDWQAGTDVRIGLFFIVPTAIVTILLGRNWGLAIALFTILFRLLFDLSGIPIRRDAPYTMAAVRGLFFLLTVYVLAAWREWGQQLEELVQERTAELSGEVAERKAAEQALHKLSMQLSDAEDAERRRLAADIHDALGQNLSVIKLYLSSAAAARNPDATSHAISESLALVDSIIAQTRTLTFAVHPPMLDDLGLVPALKWYAKEFSRQTQTQVTVEEQGDTTKLPLPTASYLFRSIKELVNNAWKHGRATEVVISVYWHNDQVRAVVDDNGSGFNPAISSSSEQRGLGLAGIRERITTMGGGLNLESEAGKGTRAILYVPLAFYDQIRTTLATQP